MAENMAEGVRIEGPPWRICKQTATKIIKFIIKPILDTGDKLSEHPDQVTRARKFAINDHVDHQYIDFDNGDGPAAIPKGKKL